MLLVVGGQSRKIGKTSLVTSLIAALPQARWTAIKITRHRHGPEPAGESAPVLETGEGYVLRRQTSAGNTDTGRYLAAGAVRAYLLEASGEGLAAAKPALERVLGESGNAIVESNSILDFLEPDLFLAVADFGSTRLKDSSRRHLARADGLAVTGSGPCAPEWKSILAGKVGRKPRFETPGGHVSPELVRFVAGRMQISQPPEKRP